LVGGQQALPCAAEAACLESEATVNLSLRNLITRSARSSIWLPIVLVELLLLAAFFALSSATANSSRQRLLAETRTTLDAVADREARLLLEQGHAIRFSCEVLQGAHAEYFQRLHSGRDLPPMTESAAYGFADNGVFMKRVNDGGASLYYTASTAVGPEEQRKARELSVLDPLLKLIVERQDLVVAAYFNSRDGLCRYYPFIEDVHEVFAPEIDIHEYTFYRSATAEHNPSRGPVWTEPYLDPAGQSWLVSCVAPVYHGETLEGVVGLDIPVTRIVDLVLEQGRPFGALSLLTVGGSILAMQEQISSLLGLDNLGAYEYSGPVRGTVAHPAGRELTSLAGGPGGELLGAAWSLPGVVQQGRIGDRDFLVLVTPLNALDACLISFVDQELLLRPVRELERLNLRAGGWMILLMVVLHFGFFAWVAARSNRVAQQIAQPVINLNAATSRFVEHFEKTHLPPSGILELEQLRRNFQRMIRARIADHSQITRINLSYSRFVPSAFLARLGRRSVLDVQPGDHAEAEMVVLVCGLRTATDRLRSRPLGERLHRYNLALARLGPIIRRHGGFIERTDRETGRALFGDAGAARAAALELLKMAAELHSDPAQVPELGISLHAGHLLLGTVGEANRLEALLLGETVDLAERLQALTHTMGSRLLASETVFQDGHANDDWRRIDRVRLADSTSPPVTLYQHLGEDAQLRDTRADFERALEAWWRGDIAAASAGFRECLAQVPGDRAAQVWIQRCEPWRTRPRPIPWSGISELRIDQRLTERS
jgi:class 3 adenylate cyclase